MIYDICYLIYYTSYFVHYIIYSIQYVIYYIYDILHVRFYILLFSYFPLGRLSSEAINSSVWPCSFSVRPPLFPLSSDYVFCICLKNTTLTNHFLTERDGEGTKEKVIAWVHLRKYIDNHDFLQQSHVSESAKILVVTCWPQVWPG